MSQSDRIFLSLPLSDFTIAGQWLTGLLLFLRPVSCDTRRGRYACSTYRDRRHHARRLPHVHRGAPAHEHHPGGLHGPDGGSLEHGALVVEWRVESEESGCVV
jgi:hypothetical protein